MKLKEFSLTKGLTVSIGKYEFLKTDVTMTFEGPNIDIEDVGKEVDEALQAEIDKTMADLHIDHIKVNVKKKKQTSGRISRRR